MFELEGDCYINELLFCHWQFKINFCPTTQCMYEFLTVARFLSNPNLDLSI